MASLPPFLRWPVLPGAAVALLAIALVRPLARHPAPLEARPAVVSLPAERPDLFLKNYCYDCHGEGSDKGGLAMDGPEGLTSSDWEHIRRHVVLHTMPPQDKVQPTPAERDTFEAQLLAWQARESLPAPASTRRLNRREFAASLHDLLGAAPDPSQLPEEEAAHGFDNNGDLQPLPPAVLERYAAVTRETVRAALLPPPVPATVRRLMPQEFRGPGGLSPDSSAFYETETNGLVQVPVNLPLAGDYQITLRAYAHAAGEEPAAVSLSGAPAQSVRSLQRTELETVTTRLSLAKGPSALTFELVNPFRDPKHPDPHRRVRRLLVEQIIVEGPLEGDATPSGNFVRIMGPVPPADAGWDLRLRAADAALTGFATRAWRQRLTPAESARLASLAGQAMAHGWRYDESLAMAVEAILTSPRFLFLTDPAAVPPAERAAALAARLSFTLHGTLPDEALLSTAAQEPCTPDQIRATASAMLDSPRAAAFARDFAGQWLQLRNTTLARPDAALFPDMTPEALAALQESAEQFFLDLVRNNRPVTDLLNAPWPRPALTPPDPDQLGLLAHPAVLLLTSYPNRTSPVLRGKYVLEALLGLQPPPPPPNVPTLQASASSGHAPQSVRAVLEAHRADPSCAACHRAIDPLGFPLEAFDAIGRFRPDTSPEELVSQTFTGETLHRPADLRAWLTGAQGLRLVHHTAERFLTYALGRGLTSAEILTARQRADAAGGRDARFRDLFLSLLAHPPFLPEI